ncbi:MAG: hypothetical protein IMZ52_02630 [Actinobacteria bacterium]|nr:hypothetical protein [Actinomycetota bacterium]
MDLAKIKEKIMKMLRAVMFGAAIGFGFAKPKELDVKEKIISEQEK